MSNALPGMTASPATPGGARGLRVLLALTLLVASGLASAQTDRPPLRVCLTDGSMPYSERVSGSGFDYELAARVARATGRVLKPVWLPAPGTIQEIEESDYPLARLRRGECHAIFSMAGPAAQTLGNDPELTLGAAYYAAAFELVSCDPDAPADLGAWKGRKVAVQSQSVAHFALLRLGAEPVNAFSLTDSFAEVRFGEATGGLLWGPALGFRMQRARVAGEHRRDETLAQCRIVEGYAPPAALRWNMHVATRTRDASLREDLDQEIAKFAERGDLHKMMRRYGLPPHSPFDETHSAAALEQLGAPAAER